MHFGPPGAAAAAASATITAWRVVFQVSDADPMKWNLTLNNTRKAQAELGADNVKIEVVAFGPGIAMLMADSAVAGPGCRSNQGRRGHRRVAARV